VRERLQLLAGRLGGQLVGAIVIFVVGMTLGPGPMHVMPRDLFVQRLPQVLIEDRLFRAGSPAVAFPAVDPLGDPVLDVLRVGDHLGGARLAHGLQTLNDSRQLHPVVGGVRLGTHQLAFVVVVAQEAGPSAGARVAEASPVRNKLNVLQTCKSSRSKKASTMSRIPGASCRW